MTQTKNTPLAAVLLAPLFLFLLSAAAPPADNGAQGAQPQRPVRITGRVESGLLWPAAHTIRFGQDGDTVDYVAEGGQDNLFLFTRWSAEANVSRTHRWVFLYQPLDIRARVRLPRKKRINGVVFPKHTAVDTRYGFDFYRLSYLFDLLHGDRNTDLELGLSLQLRNAVIDFTSVDGSLISTARNIGPVPALKVCWRQWVRGGFWWEFEADGMYAPVKYLNASDADILGALWDAALRFGYRPDRDGGSVFLTARWLGGGAEGTSRSPIQGDGYTVNWLNLVTVSLGVEIDVLAQIGP